MEIYIFILSAVLMSSFSLLVLADKRKRLCASGGLPRRPSSGSVFFLMIGPVVLLGAVMGLRYDVGTDYYPYIQIFEEVASGDQRVFDRFEPLFINVNQFINWLGLGAQYAVLFFYVATLAIMVSAIMRERFGSYTMYSVALLVFFGFGPVFGMTNSVRQSFVVALGLFFVSSLYGRRFTSSLASAAVGYGFHSSSPIMLAYSAIPRRNLGPLFWGGALATTFVAYFFISPNIPAYLSRAEVILGRFAGYAEPLREMREVSGAGVRLYFDAVLFFVLAFFAYRLPPRAVLFFNIAFVGVLLRVFLQDYSVFFRVASYFYVFVILALPWFVGAFRGVALKIYTGFIVLYSVALYLRNLSSDQFVPYQFAAMF